MARARRTLISLDATTYFHICVRAVRRSVLCGFEKVSGRNFDHRKDGNGWLYRTAAHGDIEIQDEYWCEVRSLPGRAKQESYVSTGKHQPNGKEPKSKRTKI